MNRLKRNPLLQVAKCEMCPNRVTNFVTGLCGRCSTIWTNTRRLNRVTISPYQVMAATVSLARCMPDPIETMHPTFREAMEKINNLRIQKVEIFQKLRRQFVDSVLIEQFHDQPHCPVTEDDYWNIPEIFDRDYIMFQHQVDLLEDIKPTLPADSDPNNNNVPGK